MNTYHELFPLNEYFRSVQGEGNYAGVNSLFIRFHFCNLTCTWCDTKYTWLGDHNKELVYTEDQVKEIITGSEAKHIILTGGEPALFRLDRLYVPDKIFHVETNGTVIPVEPYMAKFKSFEISRGAMDFEIIRKFNWVVSPKLSNAKQILNEKSLKYWALSDFCIFKFIIRNLSDLEEVTEVCKRFDIEKNKVYIGLEGNSLESQLKPELVDELVLQGFNFSPRLHVILWGNQRKK
jgi:7-carboxy-7-deazaguanine synthase